MATAAVRAKDRRRNLMVLWDGAPRTSGRCRKPYYVGLGL